jgi:hypothetical protein
MKMMVIMVPEETRFGDPWQYDRDLNAELVKMQTTSNALNVSYGKNVLFIRCNSDNTSISIGDTGLFRRAQMNSIFN